MPQTKEVEGRGARIRLRMQRIAARQFGTFRASETADVNHVRRERKAAKRAGLPLPKATPKQWRRGEV